MMTNMIQMDVELDESVVGDHLCVGDGSHYSDRAYLSFTNFDKNPAPNWANILSRHKLSNEDTSPQTTSHLSPEQNSISDLASFEYSQRLPSLESSSTAPIGRSISSHTSQPTLFAWQPFATSTAMHSQAPSLPGPGGHLFPLVSGSIGTYCTDFPTHSPSSTAAVTMQCGLLDSHEKSDSQFNSLTYANVSAAIAASGGRMRSTVVSPLEHELQPIRVDMSLSGVNTSSSVTPIQAYAQSVGSSNSQSSTPAHQGFSFTPNGGGSSGSGSMSHQQQMISTSGGLSSGQVYEENTRSVLFKQRSKKESHNRIERKRRDYINSQIVYLSSLLPPELYRDVDGRRNKGSVLRLSVNYIKDLRDAISHMGGIKQENSLARQLVPLLLKRIEALERIIHDQGSTLHGAPSANSLLNIRNTASFEPLYQSWLLVSESNQRASGTNGNATNLNHNSRASIVVPSSSSAGSDHPHYFQNVISNESTVCGTLDELDSNASAMCIPIPTSSSSLAAAAVKARLINVKREQTDEDRLAMSAPSRVRLDTSRLPVLCGLRSANFSDLGTASNRIDEEVSSVANINFDHQTNLSYERYHGLMQASCQPGGAFGRTE